MQDRKSTRLNSSHTVIYTLSLHDALPIFFTSLGCGSVSTWQPLCGLRQIHSCLTQSRGELTYARSEEHTSELQSHSDLHSFPTRRSSDLLYEPRLWFGFHVAAFMWPSSDSFLSDAVSRRAYVC